MVQGTSAKAVIFAGLLTCQMVLSQIVQPDLDYTSLEPYISDEVISDPCFIRARYSY